MSQTASQRAMADIDKVAESICREHRGPIWCEIPDIARQQYRRMAVAAIDALGLTEECRHVDQGTERRLASPWDQSDDEYALRNAVG